MRDNNGRTAPALILAAAAVPVPAPNSAPAFASDPAPILSLI